MRITPRSPGQGQGAAPDLLLKLKTLASSKLQGCVALL
jgi:hypothetical protein